MPKKTNNGKNVRMRCDVNCPRSVRFATPDISWNGDMSLKMPETTRSSIRIHDLEKLQPSGNEKRRSPKVVEHERDAPAIPETFVPSTSCTRHYSKDRSSTDDYRVGFVSRSRHQNGYKHVTDEPPSHSDTCIAGYRERQSWRARPVRKEAKEAE